MESVIKTVATIDADEFASAGFLGRCIRQARLDTI